MVTLSNEELTKKIEEINSQLDELKPRVPEDKLTMVVFSGDLDKLIASFIIATGASAMGSDVVMFFTFWGISALRDANKKINGKSFMAKMFGFMLPKGSRKLKLSKMNMMGMGKSMIKDIMKKNNVYSLEKLMSIAGESGVKIYLCEMSMNLMGFKPEEMIDYPNVKVCGVATFLAEAGTSQVSLFI